MRPRDPRRLLTRKSALEPIDPAYGAVVLAASGWLARRSSGDEDALAVPGDDALAAQGTWGLVVPNPVSEAMQANASWVVYADMDMTPYVGPKGGLADNVTVHDDVPAIRLNLTRESAIDPWVVWSVERGWPEDGTYTFDFYPLTPLEETPAQ